MSETKSLFGKFEKYIPEFVYGGIDGAVTTFAVVAASAGAELGAGIILILGISNMLADGFSMAVGSFLSSRAEADQAGHKDTDKNPKINSLVTFISFCILGSIPISPYIWAFVTKTELSNVFLLACIFTAVAFLIIGALQGYVNKTSKLRAMTETLSLGGVAAAVAYFAGDWLEKIIL